jgi:hypothetical protein
LTCHDRGGGSRWSGAVVGNRLHMVSGDVQSAGTGVYAHAPYYDAFEFGN